MGTNRERVMALFRAAKVGNSEQVIALTDKMMARPAAQVCMVQHNCLFTTTLTYSPPSSGGELSAEPTKDAAVHPASSGRWRRGTQQPHCITTSRYQVHQGCQRLVPCPSAKVAHRSTRLPPVTRRLGACRAPW